MADDQIIAKRHRMKHLDLFDVSSDELDNIQRVAGSIGSDLQFATFYIPIGVTALLTLLVVPISVQRVYIFYLVAIWVSFGFGIYHLIRWISNRGELKRCINKIRERQVGPIGQEGKELKPSELAALPSVPPSGVAEENK